MANYHEADQNPSFDCITGLHLFFEITDQTGYHVGAWCGWCGTAAYDGDRITDDGLPVGFIPTFTVRIPDDFHRNPTTAR